MIREEIVKLTGKAIKNLQKEGVFPAFKVPEILIEHPENELYGDYSTNVALKIAKLAKKSPMEIAELLSKKLEAQGPKLFTKIKIAKPGFINFFFSKEYLQNQVERILKEKDNFGQLDIGKDKKVQVEFISANPTGPLTVGNARGGPLGDVLGNVLKNAGFKTEKAYYVNNYGMQILTLGHSVLKDSQAKYKGDYINYLQKKVKEKDPYKAGEKAAKIIIEEMIKKTSKRLGIKYDQWVKESDLYKSKAVDRVLKLLEKKGLIYEKEGAKFFKSSKFGDERDRVIIKSDGWKTYLAGDIAFHIYKFEKKKFDKAINIWGADHYGDVLGLQAAVKALGHEGKLDIILLQFVTVLEKGEKKRMSKRKGVFVTMDELLDKVGPDVIRFLLLQKSADTHLNFDLSLAKEQSENNPVYYIQYAHARICSILRKAKSKNFKADYELLNHSLELSLIKELIKFPEVIEDTAKDYQVQRIPKYAIDLSTLLHQFYRDCKVISEDKALTQARLSLVLASKTVLKNTLSLMGISAPERM
ncbi:MAG TPA: arginine--tRNA ligase [Candidatus Parcubacteria bacterium]|nr:arginine--tRNA ligase [Candidatus Parcubacteria bacterium]